MGSKWTGDDRAKMKEATGGILSRRGDEFCVDLDGDKR